MYLIFQRQLVSKQPVLGKINNKQLLISYLKQIEVFLCWMKELLLRGAFAICQFNPFMTEDSIVQKLVHQKSLYRNLHSMDHKM